MSLIGRGLIREGTGKRYRRMKIIFLFGFEGTPLENLLELLRMQSILMVVCEAKHFPR